MAIAIIKVRPMLTWTSVEVQVQKRGLILNLFEGIGFADALEMCLVAKREDQDDSRFLVLGVGQNFNSSSFFGSCLLL